MLNKVPKIWNDYEVILGDKIEMNHIRWIKILKYGKMALVRNPKAIIKKTKILNFNLICFMAMEF